jgi:hypothetical protein
MEAAMAEPMARVSAVLFVAMLYLLIVRNEECRKWQIWLHLHHQGAGIGKEKQCVIPINSRTRPMKFSWRRNLGCHQHFGKFFFKYNKIANS